MSSVKEYVPKLVKDFCTKSGRPLRIGTGTGTKWQISKKAREGAASEELHEDLVEQLVLALKCGFYHIDTAEIYTTHPEVAEAVRRSGIKREDLWITSKYMPGIKETKAFSISPMASIDTALKELQTDYLDLFLIHMPFFTAEMTHGYDHKQVWEQLVEAKRQGKVRHVGVSNFTVENIKEIMSLGGDEYIPEFNQIEFHPYLQNQSEGILDFCKEKKIQVEAFAPLCPLSRVNPNGKDSHPLVPVLAELAKKYNVTEALILLRYALQKGVIPITTSSKEERINESLSVYTFELSDEAVKYIDTVGSKFHFRSFFVGLFKD